EDGRDGTRFGAPRAPRPTVSRGARRTDATGRGSGRGALPGWNLRVTAPAHRPLRGMRLGPLDDPAGVGHDLAVVGHEHRHRPLARELLDLPASGGHDVHEPGA